MGVFRRNPPAGKYMKFPAVIEDIPGIFHAVAALHQHRRRTQVHQGQSRLFHVLFILNGKTRQHLCLRDVRGNQGGEGNEPFLIALNGLFFQQHGTAGGHHHRIHHQRHLSMGRKEIRHSLHNGGRRKHARFHRPGRNIIKYSLQLGLHHVHRRIHHHGDPLRILGG